LKKVVKTETKAKMKTQSYKINVRYIAGITGA